MGRNAVKIPGNWPESGRRKEERKEEEGEGKKRAC